LLSFGLGEAGIEELCHRFHRFHRVFFFDNICTTNIKVLAKKERIFQHHGITVGVGIGIGIAIAVAIAIENCA